MSALESAGGAQPLRIDAGAKPVVVAVLLPLMYALFGVTWMGFIPLMPEVTEQLGVERADGALLITIISMAKSFVPILAGIIAARVGLTSTMRVAGALIVLGGVAPWLSDYATAAAVRFLFGVGGAMWVTLMGAVVLALLSPSQRPVANAVNGISVNAGVCAAFAITLPLARLLDDTRIALTLASVASALCLVALVMCGKLGDAPAKSSTREMLAAYARTLKLPATWILALAFCGPLALYLLLNTFLGQHLEQSFGLARQAANGWMTWMNIWGIPAALGAGVLLAKVHKGPRPYLIAAAVLVPAALFGAVVVDDATARAVCFALVGAGIFLPVSPLVTTVQTLPGQSPASLGMVFGTMFAVTYVVSSAVPTACGSLVASGVPLGPLLMGAGLLGASPLAGLWLLRSNPLK